MHRQGNTVTAETTDRVQPKSGKESLKDADKEAENLKGGTEHLLLAMLKRQTV